MQVSHLSFNKTKKLTKLKRDDAVFIKKEGQRKAFHIGSNSSCRAHIRQHYKLYQERCKEANIPEQHWAIPRPIWNEMEEARTRDKNRKVSKQGTLDLTVTKLVGPQVFTRQNLLHAVTQFVTVDDQVRYRVKVTLNISHQSNQSLAVANGATFRNCLVAMRPKSTLLDLPSTHDVVNHLHNEFVRWLSELQAEIKVVSTVHGTEHY